MPIESLKMYKTSSFDTKSKINNSSVYFANGIVTVEMQIGALFKVFNVKSILNNNTEGDFIIAVFFCVFSLFLFIALY